MAFTCSSCNAPSPPEARFCRLCGAPLKTAAASGPISPLAQTVPLSADPRTTDGLPMDDPRRQADTRRVGSGEIDAILQRQRLESGPVTPTDGDRVSAQYLGEQFAAPTTSSLKLPVPAQTNAPGKKRWWPVVLLTVVLVGLAAGLLVYYLRHRAANAGGEPNIAMMDQSKAVAQQLGEAQALLASGKINDAIQRLRSVVNLDPSNVEAHRLLAGALMRNGSRREAIDEYFIVAQKDPQDLPTLHALASLQFREQLYADAVDSYRRLQSAMGEARLAPQDQLDYADALRIAGFTEDARAEYQKIIASGPADIAATAKKHLAQLPLQTASGVQNNTRSLAPNPGNATTASAALPSPGVAQKLGASTGASAPVKVDPDADYSLGVSIVGSRDPKNIPRPELLHALEVLQRAAKNGQHRSQARDLAERLGKEFDRRRSLGIK